MKCLYLILIITSLSIRLFGRTQLVQIDNRTNSPFTLSAPGQPKTIHVAPNAITPLYRWVKLSHAIGKDEVYRPWQLKQGDTSETFTIQYHGLRYDLCGMRARWHEKGPYYVAARRDADMKMYDECLVGPRDISLSLIIHHKDGTTDLCLMPGDQYTRILR